MCLLKINFIQTWSFLLFLLLLFFIIIALSIAYRNDIEAFPLLPEIFETKGEILSNHGNFELASSPLSVGTHWIIFKIEQ